ncbi:MAG: hypothetical protein J7L39_00545 [Candidatus Aenigmarchaeota archaeon]|nr:hypothetical protein [Candidatus Aenigmarchaeota archaeon]
MSVFTLDALTLANLIDELLDTKKFRFNFCDTITLKLKIADLSREIAPIKRRLELTEPREILESYKLVLLYLMDMLLDRIQRYKTKNFNLTNSITKEIVRLMRLILQAYSFDEIKELRPGFKNNVQHQVYKLIKGINY